MFAFPCGDFSVKAVERSGQKGEPPTQGHSLEEMGRRIEHEDNVLNRLTDWLWWKPI
jgi:hypothetical protein